MSDALILRMSGDADVKGAARDALVAVASVDEFLAKLESPTPKKVAAVRSSLRAARHVLGEVLEATLQRTFDDEFSE